MFKKKSKSNLPASSSYVSNFSDRELRNFGSKNIPSLVVEDTESLWDFRKPITLRIHKVNVNSSSSIIEKEDIATTSVKSLPNESSDISDVRQKISDRSVKSSPNELLFTQDVPQEIWDVQQEISDISVEYMPNETQDICRIPQKISKISVKSMLNESQDIWDIQQDISKELLPNKSLDIQNIQQNISEISIKSQFNKSLSNEVENIGDKQNILREKMDKPSSIINVTNKSIVNKYQQTSTNNLKWILLPVSEHYV